MHKDKQQKRRLTGIIFTLFVLFLFILSVTYVDAQDKKILTLKDLLNKFIEIFGGKITGKQVANETPSCTNECSNSGDKQCSGNGYQTCGNYDSDSCLEWNSVTSCSSSETCSNGACIPITPTCTDECPSNGAKQCSGSGYQTCGNYDSDSCLEWNSVTSCPSGQTCSNGACISSIPTCDDPDGNGNINVKGTVTLTYSDGRTETATDYCEDIYNNGKLYAIDYYCEGTYTGSPSYLIAMKIGKGGYLPSNGYCQDGVWIYTQCTAPSCNPSNNQQYCSNGQWTGCLSGKICSSGACVSQPSQTNQTTSTPTTTTPSTSNVSSVSGGGGGGGSGGGGGGGGAGGGGGDGGSGGGETSIGEGALPTTVEVPSGGISEGAGEGERQILCDGCILEDKCVSVGYISKSKYCSITGEFNSQKTGDQNCENNFECRSNLCVSGTCVSVNLIEKIIEWFKNLFGVTT